MHSDDRWMFCVYVLDRHLPEMDAQPFLCVAQLQYEHMDDDNRRVLALYTCLLEHGRIVSARASAGLRTYAHADESAAGHADYRPPLIGWDPMRVVCAAVDY